jgi:hypothetical protein
MDELIGETDLSWPASGEGYCSATKEFTAEAQRPAEFAEKKNEKEERKKCSRLDHL